MIAFTKVQATTGVFNRWLKAIEKKKLPTRVELIEKRKLLNIVEEIFHLIDDPKTVAALREYWQGEWEKTNKVETLLNAAQLKSHLSGQKRLK